VTASNPVLKKQFEGDHWHGARCRAWNVFARSNAEIMGSNPTRGMYVCLCLFCVFVR
jgi:hypothetical protein